MVPGSQQGRRRSGSRPRGRREAEPLAASWRPANEAPEASGSDDSTGDPVADDLDERPAGKRRHRRRRGIARYGWGLYAVPLLIVATALAFFQVSEPPSTGSGGASGGDAQGSGPPLVQEAPPGGKYPNTMFSATLPPGGAVPEHGAGTFDVLPGSSPVVGSGNLKRYTVEVESGVELDGGNDSFGKLVQSTLSDPRSWTNPDAQTSEGPLALQRVDGGGPQPDFRVTLVSQQTARKVCGYDNGLPYDTSCKKGDRTYINAARWMRGAVAFESDLLAYRHYAINHEVGHVFGLKHVPCPAQGAMAPTMMQQTFSTSNDELADLNARASQGTSIPKNGFVCKPSSWPFPLGGS